jgi:integrase
MSIYKPRGSPYYQYDFQCRGHRFHGSTKRTNRREAEAVERAERDQAKQRLAETQTATTSLVLDQVIDRYWVEVGQHHVDSDNTWRNLSRLIDYFGPTTLLSEIHDDDVTRLVAWRRGHHVTLRNKQPTDKYIDPITVNRSTTEVLKKLFRRAKAAWGIRFDREPNWRAHLLPEPGERVRELVGDEGDRLEAATRHDLLPFFAFARASGFRLKECLLRWSEVNWAAGQIVKLGKGRKRISCPITPTIREILEPLQGHHAEFVFTYVADRTQSGRIKGRRYPLTEKGVSTAWQKLRRQAGVIGFRFHDFRHDVGTKLLRETGNLKLVQRALNHADIKTTARYYAHVLDADIAEAMERVADRHYRKRSRTPRRKVS